MKLIDNQKTVDHVFALVYGASGTGKTDFIGQLGGLGPTLVIDVDQGSMTLRTSPRVRPFLDNLTVVSFDRFRDLDDAYKHIQKNDPAAWNKLLGQEGVIKEPFQWVVWDSWTELQWQLMQKIRENAGIAQSALDFRKNIEIQHWGMMTDLNKLAIQSLRLLPINQVFVMLEAMSKDEVSGAIFGGPAIHGKMVQEMPGYFDIVIHTSSDLSGKYIASTKPKGRWVGKTRLGEGKEIANPSPRDLLVPKDVKN